MSVDVECFTAYGTKIKVIKGKSVEDCEAQGLDGCRVVECGNAWTGQIEHCLVVNASLVTTNQPFIAYTLESCSTDAHLIAAAVNKLNAVGLLAELPAYPSHLLGVLVY